MNSKINERVKQTLIKLTGKYHIKPENIADAMDKFDYADAEDVQVYHNVYDILEEEGRLYNLPITYSYEDGFYN